MTATTLQEIHGPVDFLLLEFPLNELKGEAAPALIDLVESGTVRIYDLLVIAKAEDGSVEAVALTDEPGSAGGFEYFAGARSGMLGDDDMQEAADAMRPGTVGALIVYENTWAVPFVGAVMRSGGELIASARIPAPQVMAALDTLESDD